MRYRRVCLEAIGYCLPAEVVTSAALEAQLQPLYQRLRLPEGRLELITGVRERRFWPAGMLPSEMSARSAQLALQAAGWNPDQVGALVHGSVCRDYLEPATACGVHHALGLPPQCQIFDASNACLGLLTGALQVANMIELGQIQAGLVVGTEGSRQLVETTIRSLNEDTRWTRADIKLAVASLTIGSASCAWLLVDRSLSKYGTEFRGASVRANTAHHELCRSGRDEAVGSGMQPLMETSAEKLLQEGVATAVLNFVDFLADQGWQAGDLQKTICHQVGPTHQRMMFEHLQLDPTLDFGTVDWLGNTGSVALPTTLALAAERGKLEHGDRVALLGIGSGINCVMAGLTWQGCAVLGWDGAASGAQTPGTASESSFTSTRDSSLATGAQRTPSR